MPVRLIDANALLNNLKESAKDAREWRDETQDEEIKIRAEQAFGTFIECALRVKNAPTIEAEPVRHGRWVYVETIGGMKHYHCTNCKEHNPGNECIADENQILWFEYCPKCGARMDGGADNG